MLYTKSILKQKTRSDGTRISVMSRHTLEDGITPDMRISNTSYDLWFKMLAPPEKLIGDYYKRGLSWQDFEMKYLAYLRNPEIVIEVENLAMAALKQDITLLCVEETAERCHRRLLAEECRRYDPDLRIEHR